MFDGETGYLSLSCGGATSFVDSSNISWVSDAAYISTGKTTTIDYTEGASSDGVPVRFFPDSDQGRKCYKLPLMNVSSLVLVRAKFVYKNYDGLEEPPAFYVSLGTAITSNVTLATNDPWTEEFIWPVTKDTLSFCLHNIPTHGAPVISSLEIRPLPRGAYQTAMEDYYPDKSLRKCYRINSGYMNGSLR